MEEVRINPGTVPDCMWDTLASGTLELLRDIKAAPGGREALEKKKAQIRSRRVAK